MKITEFVQKINRSLYESEKQDSKHHYEYPTPEITNDSK